MSSKNKSIRKMYALKIVLSVLGCILVVGLIGFFVNVRDIEVELKIELQDKIIDIITPLQRKNDANEIMHYNRSIFIYKEINQETVRKVCSLLLSLESADPQKEINLYINNLSGTIEDSFAIIGVMNSLQCKINTIATGDCKSVGTFILCNGTGNIRATRNAIISIYFPGKLLNSDDESDRLRAKRIISLWKSNKKIKLPPQWFEDEEPSIHYLTPQEAKKYGIINKIISK
jgi:ATP-dependent Clp protease, protease subunit